MILLDQDLDAAKRPRSKAAAASTVWRRSPLPWSERLPTSATLRRFLSDAQSAVRLRGQVTVLLTTDAALRNLNRRFRRKNNPTDVLSFPSAIPGPEKTAGDLAISVETARRQANEHGHALTCELKILILHGLLHLAGYDHESDSGQMRRRERKLRTELRLPEGLTERVESRSSTQWGIKPARGCKPARRPQP